MAREAKLSKKTIGKHTYWLTSSGGKPVYFGNVKDVKRKEAEEAFVNHRKKVLSAPKQTAKTVSAGELADQYGNWSKDQFSASNYANKKSCLNRWTSHTVGSGLYGEGQEIQELPAIEIGATHLLDFIKTRRESFAKAGRGTGKDKPPKPVGPNALAGDMQHVKACFNWGADNGYLPKDFRPFSRVARIKIPKRPKHESELLTKSEIAALLKYADYDLEPIRGANGQFRTRKKTECRKGAANPYSGFADLLRLYHGLGARTSELASIQVKHVDFKKGQIVVRHKRENTMADPVPRVLTLNETELAIFERHCDGKAPSDYVFTQPGGCGKEAGSPWKQDRLDERFAKVRKLAKVRDTITIYSYRHLWISEAIEADMPMATIAEMAGTSIKQIEATYGHIRHEHRSDARSRLDSYRSKLAG